MTDTRKKLSERLTSILHDEINKREKRIYSERLLEECENPKNQGKIDNCDAHCAMTGSCGDTIELYLKIKNNKITDIKFLTDGCKATIACCSVLTEMVKGMEIEDAKEVSSNDLISILNGLPEDHEHCAVLSVGTLRTAIRDYYRT